eukprot:c13882_g1_i2.p1 GENE.c13882_g1_i2~~c13882_g1_i2.p1  ORF type:complete len:383 (+),score=95.77 c13882_g1_i2:249-1397(+)
MQQSLEKELHEARDSLENAKNVTTMYRRTLGESVVKFRAQLDQITFSPPSSTTIDIFNRIRGTETIDMIEEKSFAVKKVLDGMLYDHQRRLESMSENQASTPVIDPQGNHHAKQFMIKLEAEGKRHQIEGIVSLFIHLFTAVDDGASRALCGYLGERVCTLLVEKDKTRRALQELHDAKIRARDRDWHRFEHARAQIATAELMSEFDDSRLKSLERESQGRYRVAQRCLIVSPNLSRTQADSALKLRHALLGDCLIFAKMDDMVRFRQENKNHRLFKTVTLLCEEFPLQFLLRSGISSIVSSSLTPTDRFAITPLRDTVSYQNSKAEIEILKTLIHDLNLILDKLKTLLGLEETERSKKTDYDALYKIFQAKLKEIAQLDGN